MTKLYLLLLCALALVSCRAVDLQTRFTADGCVLVGRSFDHDPEGAEVLNLAPLVEKKERRGTAWVGICMDGRWIAQWESEQLDGTTVTLQFTRYPDKRSELAYKTPGGWVAWGPKSGIQIGPVPDGVELA